jgi:hypothetical protein
MPLRQSSPPCCSARVAPLCPSLPADTAKFLNDLKTYDRDNITERVILEIAPFMDMPEFQPEVIERASKACSGVCMWVRAMYKYYYVAKMVCGHCSAVLQLCASLGLECAWQHRAHAALRLVVCALPTLSPLHSFTRVCVRAHFGWAGGAKEEEAGGGAGATRPDHGGPERRQAAPEGRAGPHRGPGGPVYSYTGATSHVCVDLVDGLIGTLAQCNPSVLCPHQRVEEWDRALSRPRGDCFLVLLVL